MINILIVDDSEVERTILTYIFQSAPDIQIVGYAKHGKEAVELAAQLHPDLITMDIHMPFMDGFEAIRLIMSQNPTPIVVISSTLNDKELNTTFRSLEAGALSVLEKPMDITSPQFENSKNHILHTVRAMSEVNVIKRRFSISACDKPLDVARKYIHRHYQLLAIGTSVGGPQVLKKILSDLPEDFPVPIVIVQHMTQGFISGFVKWLDDNIVLKVKNAEQNEILKKGTVYFAPDNFHLEVVSRNGKLISNLVSGDPVSGFCPSATVLLNSVAKVCGKNAVGALLTGMGSDGASGLLALKHAEGHTIIQDPSSTVVFGMAGVAQSLGAVDKVVKLDQFAKYLTTLFITEKINT